MIGLKSNHVIFRVDASVQIGSGHVMRCLTLAGQLHKHGARISFICRDLPGNLSEFVRAKGYAVYLLEMKNSSVESLYDENAGRHQLQHADWLTVSQDEDAMQVRAILDTMPEKIDLLVVDHYALDMEWEQQMSYFVNRILVIDDLADRRHVCEMLLDQNLYMNMTQRYLSLVPAHCKLFLGPQHALLREEFYENKKSLRSRNGSISNVFVFYGGSDPTNETLKAMKAIQKADLTGVSVHVVVGSSNPQKRVIEEYVSQMDHVRFYGHVDHISELMSEADLALGAGGSTTWERCMLGLPSLVTVVAENQWEMTEAVAASRAITNLGWYHEVTEQMIADHLIELFYNPKKVLEMSNASRKIIDVEGLNEVSLITAINEG
ncbi:UDP-2,4-diacetamido-2,4,6-trideoxy-beta-L-altropyranose hydrolase [Paenibacillus sp. LjRoot56]|uniref:UDP-2,4-diacetamido-2,4, 6-trideoxy-beta-L-altropyranose hydrolase n=1 Tax=Paenibacillus sp. LjRoot56 TaxID=3342333 RepID=UPI003F508592